ncbi:DUF788-domain-containing protein [Atractiella rhizophila]|nr:DUF788-domain-containing protein [Atractiella rhizophila]
MAGQANKRISASNAQTLKMLRLGFIASNLLHLLQYVFRKFSTRYLGFYIVTEILALLLWQQLEKMGAPNSGVDINTHTGFISYFFDVIYVTWFVHSTTPLWRGFWWIYLAIPAYAFYRIASLLFPFVSNFIPSLRSSEAGGDEGEWSTSRRQQKLQKRAEKRGGVQQVQRR